MSRAPLPASPTRTPGLRIVRTAGAEVLGLRPSAPAGADLAWLEMTYLTRRGGVALACATLLTVCAFWASAGAQPTTGSLTTSSYSNAAGTLSYELYVPASYRPGSPMPMVVA